MTAACHRLLGRYLVEQYLSDMPRRYVRAFLVGCVEPDRNYLTYIKGSIRSQWLRGHNWGNSQRYICRISNRLEQKTQLRMLDFYRMGKLIHYTTDAFTYAHNEVFQENLRQHRNYEDRLQLFFPQYLRTCSSPQLNELNSVADTIRAYHLDYLRRPYGMDTDSRFSVTVCCAILSLLVQEHRQRSAV